MGSIDSAMPETPASVRPAPVATVDLAKLNAACVAYFEEIEQGKHDNDDSEHRIFEVAMKTLYGDNVFEYINSKLK